jgi:hypothetical protein
LIPLQRFKHGSWWALRSHPDGAQHLAVEVVGRPFLYQGAWCIVVDRHHTLATPVSMGTRIIVKADALEHPQHRHPLFLSGCGRHLLLDDECYQDDHSERMSGRGRVSVVRERLAPWCAR